MSLSWDRLARFQRARHAVPYGRRCGDFQNAHLRVANGVGVVVDVDLLHVGFAFLEVEMLDVVLLPPCM